jgi:ABC-type Na+ efflux pump permease subunit
MMPRIATLFSALFLDAFALLAVDEIPGWTDLSNLARASVVGFLLVMLAVVVICLLRAISILLRTMREQQTASQKAIATQQAQFIAEVQAARKDSGEAIISVRKIDDARYESLQIDLREASKAVSALAVAVAQSQEQKKIDRRTDHADHIAERHEDQAQIKADRHEDQAQVLADRREDQSGTGSTIGAKQPPRAP